MTKRHKQAYLNLVMYLSSSPMASSKPEPFLFLTGAGGSLESMNTWMAGSQALQWRSNPCNRQQRWFEMVNREVVNRDEIQT